MALLQSVHSMTFNKKGVVQFFNCLKSSLKQFSIQGHADLKSELKGVVERVYDQTVASLENAKRSLASTRQRTQDPELDLEFQHKEDEILVKLCYKRHILNSIDRMVWYEVEWSVNARANSVRKEIREWEQELKKLLANVRRINERYSNAVMKKLLCGFLS